MMHFLSPNWWQAAKGLRRMVPAGLVAQEDSEVSRSACLGSPLFQGSNTLSSRHLEFLSLAQPALSSTPRVLTLSQKCGCITALPHEKRAMVCQGLQKWPQDLCSFLEERAIAGTL